jgi:glucose-1-phosphate adenylyltransferase
MSKVVKIICLILGGGAGTRLSPLTASRSKPAVPIGGKYRLIDIPISNCLNSGIRRMFVLTQFNSTSLNRHIKNTYHFDNFSSGFVDILAAEQTPQSQLWFQGTADAVRQSFRHWQGQDFDYILILSGDQLYQMDLKEFAERHVAAGAQVSIATIPVTAKDATGFGIMKVNKDSVIEKFVEKPKADVLDGWKSEVSKEDKKKGKVFLASMGIYIFNREVLEKLFADHLDETDFGKGIIPKAIEENYKVTSYEYRGYWEDIGTIRSFFDANIALTDNIPDFDLFDNGKAIYTRARMLPPAKFSRSTTISRSIISDGCIILSKKIERSIIGIRARIGERTVIKNAIIMGNDYFQRLEEIIEKKGEVVMGIGANCHIEEAIVDKNCYIGDNVTIKGGKHLANGDFETHTVVDGIIVLKKGALIPNGTKIGA